MERQFITHLFILIIVMRMNGLQTNSLLRLFETWTKSDVVSASQLKQILGLFTQKELSGGVKTVLLMLFDETGRIFQYMYKIYSDENVLPIKPEKIIVERIQIQV